MTVDVRTPNRDIALTLRPHRVGADPTTLIAPGEFWRATLTPEGPGTLHLRWSSTTGDPSSFEAEGFGPGGEWLCERAGDYAGMSDPGYRFGPTAHPVILEAQRSLDLRISRGHCLYHTLLPTVLGQRVTAVEAHRSWRRLCVAYGRPAPGPGTLLLPPEPNVLVREPYWRLHPLGIDRQRAEALREVARNASRIFALDDANPAQAESFLCRIPGIGPWTIGASLGHALGDLDAVAVGDYHLKNTVAWALAGEPRASDERMLELLEPYRGQRGRVIALLGTRGFHAPRFGPRQRILPMERW